MPSAMQKAGLYVFVREEHQVEHWHSLEQNLVFVSLGKKHLLYF